MAIKVLPASFAEDPDRLRRFEKEARAAGGLNHPNLVTVFDVGSHEGGPFLVLELLEGASLRALLAEKPLPVRRAIDYAVQIAVGLSAAHEGGIVHRDLKPDNLFVTRDGRVKILDFGLARTQEPLVRKAVESEALTASRGTESGVTLGTTGYMSPEQVRGAIADPRSDIFSFGCVLYELLAGRRAFARETAAETLTAILREEPPELVETAKQLPVELIRIVGHCLEKKPEERFQSARDLAFSLKTVASGSVGSPARPHVPTRRRWMTGALSAAALLAAFAAGWLSRGGASLPEPPAVVPLTTGAAHDFAPALSPDGKFIAYLSDAGGRSDVWVKFVGGGPAVNLTLDSRLVVQSNSGVGTIDISPDGAWISVRASQPDSPTAQWATWVIPAPTGGPLRKLVNQASGARWSPDGKRLAFIRTNPVAGDAIVVCGSDGQDERVLVAAAGGVHLHQPAWSHDGAYVYFIRTIIPNNEAPTEIWRVAASGGTAEPVVPTTGVALNPTPTPDGSALVYAGDRKGEGLNLWWRPLRGGPGRRLTAGSGEYAEPRLSLDGRRLVCTARTVHASLAVVRLSAAGQGGAEDALPTVTGRRAGDSDPSVCARTRQIVFVSTRNGSRNIWAADLPPDLSAKSSPALPGGPEARQLTSGRETDDAPVLSPDGSTVAFVSDRGGRRGIWLVATDGGAPRRLLEADVMDRPSWSPDSRRLVYCEGSSGELALWILSRDGGAATRVAGAKGRVPAWSAKDVIAYVAEDPATGTGIVRFVTPEGKPLYAEHVPSIAGATAAAWSHEGARLALASTPGNQSPSLWVFELASQELRRLASFSPYSRVKGVSWAPDDKSLIIGRAELDSHILLLDGLASQSP